MYKRQGEKVLGVLGPVDPAILEAFEIEIPVFFAEVDLEVIAEAVASDLSVEGLPKVPDVLRDMAIVVSEEVSYQALGEAIRQAGGALLKSAQLFDLYKGSPIPAGKKSLAFRLTFSASNRTLTDEEVTQAFQGVVKTLQGRFEATLR